MSARPLPPCDGPTFEGPGLHAKMNLRICLAVQRWVGWVWGALLTNGPSMPTALPLAQPLPFGPLLGSRVAAGPVDVGTALVVVLGIVGVA